MHCGSHVATWRRRGEQIKLHSTSEKAWRSRQVLFKWTQIASLIKQGKKLVLSDELAVQSKVLNLLTMPVYVDNIDTSISTIFNNINNINNVNVYWHCCVAIWNSNFGGFCDYLPIWKTLLSSVRKFYTHHPQHHLCVLNRDDDVTISRYYLR